MTSDRLITLAIHTYEKALPLKTMLEREGLYVELNNVNLDNPTVSAGVRIRVREEDLPLALRIVENIEIFNIPVVEDPQRKGGELLVPTDFSQHSANASKLAFSIAARQKLKIKFLHAYLTPGVSMTPQISDAYDFGIVDMEARKAIEQESRKLMDDYAAEVRRWIRDGVVPPCSFSCEVEEGIPEEVILEYARAKSPQMIVMGTRGTDKKEAELIGSVTAEVLDSCRIPAFTVPENIDVTSMLDLRRVAFLCNLDQEDMIALDTLYRMFGDSDLEVMLVHIPGKRERWQRQTKDNIARLALMSYCREHFPRFNFDMRTIALDTMMDDFRTIIDERPAQLICVPNKKRNVFARVFNPSLAHKILFRADVPMMVIPV